MRNIVIILLGCLCIWGYQQNIHQDLADLCNTTTGKERTRTLNVLEAKTDNLFNNLFSGCNFNKDKTSLTLNRPLDLNAHVNSIVRRCTGHDEKIRAIYRWITRNIAYDTDYSVYMADQCYLQGKGVCNAYTSLMMKMLDCAGIRSVKVNGKVYRQGSDTLAGHSWIMIEKADGSFMLADPTWDAGYVNPKTGHFVQSPRLEWYDCPPERMIRTHLPDNTRHQLLAEPVSEETFAQLNRSARPYMERALANVF